MGEIIDNINNINLTDLVKENNGNSNIVIDKIRQFKRDYGVELWLYGKDANYEFEIWSKIKIPRCYSYEEVYSSLKCIVQGLKLNTERLYGDTKIYVYLNNCETVANSRGDIKKINEILISKNLNPIFLN